MTSPNGVLVAGDELAFVTGHGSLTRARIADGLVEVTGTELLLPDGSRPPGRMLGRICRDNRM